MLSKGGDIIIREKLLRELEKMEVINEIAGNGLAVAPPGTLRLGNSRGKVQYFHCTEQKGKEFIRKSDIEIAERLAQKAYDEKIFNYTKKMSMLIRKLLKEYDDYMIEKLYLSEHIERQKLITPVEPTYEQALGQWSSQSYIGKGFSEDAPVIKTNNGVRVRSKSEKILADYFESIGLIYKYECPLVLKPYGVIYPDFTFLSRKTRQEIYWEHEGMLDNPEYARSATKKIEMYEKNGIFPGERLILTYETSTDVISTETIKLLVSKYLL